MSFPVIRTCPALDGNYPIVSAQDSSASSYTANIYDMASGTQLNTGAYTTGTEISTISVGTGVAGVLDMGHANVIADWDALTAEDANILVEMIPNTGTPQYTHVKANDAEHVALLYPNNTLYVDGAVTAPATTFPYGSINYPLGTANQVATALTARGYLRVVVRSALGGADGPTAAGVGTAFHSVTFVSTTDAIIFPQTGEQVDFTDARFEGCGLSTANTGSRALGPFTLVGGRVTGSLQVGGTASRYGQITAKGTKFEGSITLNSLGLGCWTAEFEDCTFPSNQTITYSSMGGGTTSYTRCTGPFTIASLAASKTCNVVGHQGSPTITIASSSSATANFSFTGAINAVTDSRASGTYTLAKIAHLADLTGNVTTLAAGAVNTTSVAAGAISAGKIGAGAITATEAPALANLDVPVSSIAALSSSGSLSATVVGDNTSAALNGVTFVGVVTSGTYANLIAEGGVTLVLDDDGSNNIDWVAQYDVPISAIPTALLFSGYVNSSNDSVPVQVYDHVNSVWETRATVVGTNTVVNTQLDITLGETRFVSSTGIVYVRFVTSGGSNPTLTIDRLILAYLNESGGYENGSIWIDTIAGVAGTSFRINGTVDNPVDTLADADTINTAHAFNRYRMRGGSSITLAQNYSSYVFNGENWTLNLGSRQIDSCFIHGAQIVGSVSSTSGSTSQAFFERCLLGVDSLPVTIGPSQLQECGIYGLTLGSAGNYRIWFSNSLVAGSGRPTIDCNSQVVNLELRNWSGGVNLTNVVTGTRVSIEGMGGTVSASGTTTDSGSIRVRGAFEAITDTTTAGDAIFYDAVINATTMASIITAAEPIDANITSVAGSAVAGVNDFKADVSLLATAASIAALNDFDPATQTVTVGTNNDKTGYSISGTITTLDGLNDLSIADVGTALTSYGTATATNVSAVETNVLAELALMEGTTFDTATDSLEAIRDRGDAAWVTGGGGASLTQQNIRDALLLAPTPGTPAAGSIDDILSTLSVFDSTTDTVTVGTNNDKSGYSISGTITTLDGLNDISIADVGTALASYGAATATNVSAVQTAVLADTSLIKGTTFDTATDSLEAIRDRGDVAWITGGGGASLTQQNVRDAMLLAPTPGTPAAGSIDDTLSTLSTFDAVTDTVTVGTNNDKSGYSISGTITTLDGLNDISIADVSGALTSYGVSTATNVSAVQTAVLADTSLMKGATFDTLTDSLESIRNRGDAAWVSGSSLTQQNVRDALLLAPTAGTPASGSIDNQLSTLTTDVGALNDVAPADITAAIRAEVASVTPGSLGHYLAVIAGVAAKYNVRFFNMSYVWRTDINGNQIPFLTGGTIRVYPTASDAVNDTNALEELSLTGAPDATYLVVPSTIISTG